MASGDAAALEGGQEMLALVSADWHASQFDKTRGPAQSELDSDSENGDGDEGGPVPLHKLLAVIRHCRTQKFRKTSDGRMRFLLRKTLIVVRFLVVVDRARKNRIRDIDKVKDELLPHQVISLLKQRRQHLEDMRYVCLAKLKRLIWKKYAADSTDPIKRVHPYEGLWHCAVRTLRGGSVEVEVITKEVLVHFTDPNRLVCRMWESYNRGLAQAAPVGKYRVVAWFRDGRIDGLALVQYDTGDWYQVFFVHDRFLTYRGESRPTARRHALGQVDDAPGPAVRGQPVDNHFDNINGEYRITFPNDEIYEGEVVDGPHGMGERRYRDGSVYKGEFFRGKRQGFGVFVSPGGNAYQGEWDQDEIHGEGVWKWEDGSMYIGTNKHNRRDGYGVYITALGDIYRGDFGPPRSTAMACSPTRMAAAMRASSRLTCATATACSAPPMA